MRILLPAVDHAAPIADVVPGEHLIAVVLTGPEHWQVSSIHRVDTLASIAAPAPDTLVHSILVCQPTSSCFDPKPETMEIEF